VAAAHPSVVAIDVTLTDQGDESDDQALEEAFCQTPRLVLCSLLMDDPVRWENPNPRFAHCAAAIGHVHAEPDDRDSITRSISIEKYIGNDRRWALGAEAFRLSRNAGVPLERVGRYGTGDVVVGGVVIPAKRTDDGRVMQVRFVPPGMAIPKVSLVRLLNEPALASRFTGKAVFVGVTAETFVRDRLFTPYAYGRSTTGIEINASAFEPSPRRSLLPTWGIMGAGVQPGTGGGDGPVVPLSARLVGIRRRCRDADGGACRALICFSPTARFLAGHAAGVRGAGQSGGRYVLSPGGTPELARRAVYPRAVPAGHALRDPRDAHAALGHPGLQRADFEVCPHRRETQQVADLINSESKRLARMVEVFLHVERLSAGQMELKPEPIAVRELVEVCVNRVRPVAERKRITITLQPLPGELLLSGDRELMEYACYNLLTNAVKYSPQRTEVTVTARSDQGQVRIAVQDQESAWTQKK